MPKIDKTVLKLIKTLKKFNMHKTASNTKLKGGNHGNYSCISMTPIQCDSKDIIWKSKYLNDSMQLITKIITRKDIFEKELAIAQYIDNNLAYDSTLLYALEACSLPSSDERVIAVLQNCKNEGEMHKGKDMKGQDMDAAQLTFDKTASTVYLFQIEYGGITLDNFIKTYTSGSVSDDILYDIIKQILNIINDLHSYNIVYADLNNHNNITLKPIDDTYKVSIIDFGEARLNANPIDKKKDIEDSLEIIQFIASLMQESTFKNKLKNFKIESRIDTLITNLTNFYDQYKGTTMTDAELEANLARLIQGQQVVTGTPTSTPTGTPQGTPVSAEKRIQPQAELVGKRLKF
jgi:serine/threonine protein kinase